MSLTGNGTAPIDAMCSKDGDLAGNIVMGVLGFGTFLSYVPAWYEVVSNRSSRGISVTSIFLLNFTNYATTLGVLLQNWVSLVCCDNGEFDTGECLAGINPIFLVGANVAGCIPLYILTLFFFDEDGDEDSSPKAAASNSSTGLKKQDSRRASDDDACSDVSATSSTFPQQLLDVPENRLARFTSKRQALGSFAVFVVIVGITSIVSAVLIAHTGYDSNYTQRYADASNIAAAIAMVLTWMPQILHTYRLKDVGSLSIITLAIQAPGAAGVCISLILDGQELSSIASNAVASVCLFFLVAQCIKYKYCSKTAPASPQADDPTLALDPELGRSYGSCEEAETDVNNGPLAEDSPPALPGAKLSTITSPPVNPCSPLNRLGRHCCPKH